ncbi:MAG: hypothetical protein K6T75_00465 [Acetobacteraceae bacterium]|nr:hypothetical protein [Acetobacteraceae bacterium]
MHSVLKLYRFGRGRRGKPRTAWRSLRTGAAGFLAGAPLAVLLLLAVLAGLGILGGAAGCQRPSSGAALPQPRFELTLPVVPARAFGEDGTAEVPWTDPAMRGWINQGFLASAGREIKVRLEGRVLGLSGGTVRVTTRAAGTEREQGSFDVAADGSWLGSVWLDRRLPPMVLRMEVDVPGGPVLVRQLSITGPGA